MVSLALDSDNPETLLGLAYFCFSYALHIFFFRQQLHIHQTDDVLNRLEAWAQRSWMVQKESNDPEAHTRIELFVGSFCV